MGKLLIGCLCVASCLSLEAAVLLSEDFSYPNGALTNVSGGKWVLHSGNRAGLFVKNGAVELDASTTVLTDDVHAPLAGAPIKPDSGVVLFASFDVKLIILPTGAGGYFAHFKDPATLYRARVYATTDGARAGCYRLGIANGGTALVPLAANLSLNTTYKVVVRYDVASAASALWVNPAAETDPGVQAADSATAPDIVSYALRQSLSSGAGAGKVIVDNLVVATSFAEALALIRNFAAARGADGTVALTWDAEVGRTYTVWSASQLSGPFSQRANGLTNGLYAEPPIGWAGAVFYRLSTP